MSAASLVAPAGVSAHAALASTGRGDVAARPTGSANATPASAAAAVVEVLAGATGPAHRVADFAHTQLFGVPSAAGTRLVALTRNGASYSANSVRLDNTTFEALRLAPTVQVSASRWLRAGTLSVHIVRTWRSDVVVRRNERPSPDGLRAELPAAPVAPDTFEELVGRGLGLTPTGDDLVCGFLAAAHAYADPQLPDWANEVRQLRCRTSDLSAEFLRLAADGHVCSELRDLLLAMGTDHLPSAVRRLRAVGHTSGTDLAHGVLRYLENTTTNDDVVFDDLTTDSVTDHEES